MIDIYTERKDSKDWIFYNDLYFNLNTGNEDMSQKEVDLIQQVDEAKLTPDKHIETKYGLGTIRNLSSGCKTLLNIVKHPDKVVNVAGNGTRAETARCWFCPPAAAKPSSLQKSPKTKFAAAIGC